MAARSRIGILLLAGVAGLIAAAGQPGAPADPPGGDRLRPRWRVGDRWVVETTAWTPQASDELPPAPGDVIPWHFAVTKIETIGGRECYRVEVTVRDDDATRPVAAFWADEKTLVLRQVQTVVTVQGRLRAMTERYDFPRGGEAPVFGPLTAFPLDLPVFTGGARGGMAFSYRATADEPGARAGDSLAFAVEVEQRVAAAPADDVKRLLAGPSARAPDAKLIEVRLTGAGRQVRQFWQPGLPWPVYADNGQVEARLVKVVPPGTER